MTSDLSFVPRAIASRAVFEAAGQRFTWQDVVEAADARDEITDLSVEITRANALLTGPTGTAISAESVVEATTAFRYDRNLIAGDDLLAWLERWRLTLDEWHGYVRRALARSAAPNDSSESDEPADLAAMLWPEAVCSGWLERAANRLAADFALLLEAGATAETARSRRWRDLAMGAAAVRNATTTPDAIAREVAANRLPWLRVEGTLVELPDADVAREAAMCVRVDGRPLAEVAAECGAEPQGLSLTIEEAGEDFSAALIAAAEGELVGPLRREGLFVLLDIRRKVAPSTSDPLVQDLAHAKFRARIEQRAISRHVTWHASF